MACGEKPHPELQTSPCSQGVFEISQEMFPTQPNNFGYLGLSETTGRVTTGRVSGDR
jgi:hypothetical protein